MVGFYGWEVIELEEGIWRFRLEEEKILICWDSKMEVLLWDWIRYSKWLWNFFNWRIQVFTFCSLRWGREGVGIIGKFWELRNIRNRISSNMYYEWLRFAAFTKNIDINHCTCIINMYHFEIHSSSWKNWKEIKETIRRWNKDVFGDIWGWWKVTFLSLKLRGWTSKGGKWALLEKLTSHSSFQGCGRME